MEYNETIRDQERHMLIDKKAYTKTEFYEFIQLPKHAGRVLELIDDGVLDGGDVLPNFSVRDIFPT